MCVWERERMSECVWSCAGVKLLLKLFKQKDKKGIQPNIKKKKETIKEKAKSARKKCWRKIERKLI